MTINNFDLSARKLKCPKCKGLKLEKLSSSGIVLPCKKCGGTGAIEKPREVRRDCERIYFYIDQNIISEMRKGVYQIPNHRIFDLSEQRRSFNTEDFVTFVYSSETIKEISRTGNEEPYLEVLTNKKARKFLEFNDLMNSKIINRSVSLNGKLHNLLCYIDPVIHYEFYMKHDNLLETTLSDMILLSNTVLFIANMIGLKFNDFEYKNLEKQEKLEQLCSMIESIREKITVDGNAVSLFYNSKKPIDDTWRNAIVPVLKVPNITDNLFFCRSDSGGLSSDLIKAHLVLNIIGYYPDTTKKVVRNFNGFMSDIRHINHAQKADVFLSYDKNLAHRAAALYQWENSKTGHNLMTVFKRFGKKDIENHCAKSNETADQASDRSVCLYTGGKIL